MRSKNLTSRSTFVVVITLIMNSWFSTALAQEEQAVGFLFKKQKPSTTEVPEAPPGWLFKEKAKTPTASEEVDTMSRVLERVLDRSMGREWHNMRASMSGFQGRVNAAYIPTVGAIFTIPTSFPLVDAQEVDETKNKQQDDEDLWGQLADPENRGAGNIQLEYARRDDRPAQYAEAKERLVRAVIETMAQYGHRMEGLPNSDRVLVILEGSSASSNAKFQITRRGAAQELQLHALEMYERAKKLAGDAIAQREGALAQREELIFLDLEEARAQQSQAKEPSKTRRLLTFQVSDLKPRTSYEALKRKVKEVAY